MSILETSSTPAPEIPAGIGPAIGPVDTPLRRFTRDFFSSRIATCGFIALVLVIIAALFAPVLSPQNPYDLAKLDVMDSRLAPGKVSEDGTLTFILGTDEQGRDMLSAILYGVRISMLVGVVSTLIALAIGLLLGLFAGYAGGRTETECITQKHQALLQDEQGKCGNHQNSATGGTRECSRFETEPDNEW